MKSYLLVFSFILFAISQGFSEGFYLEFKISTDKGTLGNMKAFSQDGDSRSEVSFSLGGNSPQAMMNNIVMLVLKDKPDMAYMLDVNNKTYNEMDISKKEDSKDYDPADYEVTVLGKEKVNGYNATHVKVKNKKGDNLEEEMWTTTEIPGYADLEKIKTKYTGKENINKALAAKGAEGFPVKITFNQRGIVAHLDLVKAEKRNNPASLFSLAGYTKSANDVMGANVQQLMQQMQNMTPEQRQKFIEQMKQQLGGAH